MRVSVILGHPSAGSFNHAIAGTVVDTLTGMGHQLWIHDLYAEKFDPVLPSAEIPRDAPLDPLVARHCEEIARADGIVVIHPNWWWQPPGILKGWIDRVLRPGVAYEFLDGDAGDGIPKGLLRAKAALVFNTANTPQAREQGIFGDPLEGLWRTCIFEFCGVPAFDRRMYSVVVTSTPEQRAAWLADVVDLVSQWFPPQEI